MLKRFFLVILILLSSSVLFVNCTGKKSELETEVEDVQSLLPIPIDGMGELTGVELDDTTLILTYEVSETEMDFDKFEKNIDLAKKSMLASFQLEALDDGSEASMYSSMLSMLDKADTGMKCIFKKKGSSKEAIIRIYANEIKDAKDNKIDAADRSNDLVDNEIEQISSSLPLKCADGFYLSSLENAEENLIMLFTVDEEVYDLDEFTASFDAVRNDLLEGFKEDKDSEMLFSLLRNTGKGLVFRLVGSETGDYVDIAFSHDEL